ncbi:hypothetical protein AMS68_005702 [Peltaster fructicola]|uniref:FAD-binding domain-containing protein n=1 Tax=Peltaster fructicola TaxID=286661 RepID=A0A6H0XZU1_9PEZI|nr:hypothetical protein AMS68_005702 [Peltaster fructicola]
MAPDYKLSPDRDYSIAVVGGGIAAHAFAEIGAGVSLGPNAIRAMSMIDPAIRKGFENCATNNLWPDRQQYWFSFRKGQDHSSHNGTNFCNLVCETGQTSVHRATFLDELVALIPDGVAHFGKRLVDAEDQGDHVVLHFADGTKAKHSALVGCDGVKSRTRQIVLGEDHPTAHAVFSGKYAYRGLIPMEKAKELLGEEVAANAQMFFGHRGHILTFPIEHGKTMNVVAFASKDGEWGSDQWVQPMNREHMEKDFEGWVPAARQILQLMQKPDVWALFEHLPAPTYHKGRVVLLGDAAHASTPHQGANAGQAIEDSLIMSKTMAHVYKAEDIPKAFAAFDKVRRPRTQKQVKTAHEAGMLYDLELPGYDDDFNKIEASLQERMSWIWDHDLEADIQEAARIFSNA